ncbi:MAG: FkbM family methyltransferase [Candidatus Absconditabacteria bacterium]|nr:FkbM family methyltransferase [Candidatus Absconditabacteria bacterium]
MKKHIETLKLTLIGNIFVRKLLEWIKLAKLVRKNHFSIYTRYENDLHLLGSFGSYLYNSDSIETLKKGLDHETLSKIENILSKIQLLFQNNVTKFKYLYGEKEIRELKDLSCFLRKHKKVAFPQMYYFQQKTKATYKFDIKGKDILDIGACIGDTSITFHNLYSGSRVYGFEPEINNLTQFQKNIRNIKNIETVNLGVSNFEGTARINNSGGISKLTLGENNEEIHITTIDKFVSENNLNPGMIKRDIEGEEYNSLLGSEKTIKKFKPILFISIYHTGKDFFEIKPLIESWDIGYKFGIEKRNTHPFIDTVLVCYNPHIII